MSEPDKDARNDRPTDATRRAESRDQRIERQKRAAYAIMARYRLALRELAK